MLKTQMAISEIINVKVSDYNREGISIYFKDKQSRNCLLDEELRNLLDDYINERKNMYYSDSEYMFISNKGGSIDKRHIFHLFSSYSKATKLIHPITPGKITALCSVEEEPESRTYEIKVDDIYMDINVHEKEIFHGRFVNIEVLLTYKKKRKEFYFVGVKPDFIHILLNGEKGIYPKGFFITPSFSKENIQQLVIDSFYFDEQSQIDFLNHLELHSLGEEEINIIEERIVFSNYLYNLSR